MLRRCARRWPDMLTPHGGAVAARPGGQPGAGAGQRLAVLTPRRFVSGLRHRVSRSRIAVAYQLNWSSGSGRLRVTSPTYGRSWRVTGWEAHVLWAPNQGLSADFPARDFVLFTLLCPSLTARP